MKTTDRIKELLDLMEREHLLELEVEEEGFRVKLRKAGAEPPAAHAEHPGDPKAAKGKGAPQEIPGRRAINSPIVGTFYRSPSPEAPSFVEVGDRVTTDTVVCIIEAMKVMNEIKPDVSGVVAEILVANGEAVEYGQPIFTIDVSAP